jgi:hypothetical protein
MLIFFVCREVKSELVYFAKNKYILFKKELYNGIPNVTVWLVLWRRLYLKTYKLSKFKVLNYG